ncbi:DNA polymerase III subunit epsilon [Bacteroidia bacterium]|nr:DNA polymerase III subunit epsilon [Bacteroidia bacterium]
MKLVLTKPLVFFDLETTSVNPKETKIVEICLHKIFPDLSSETMTMRIHPGIPIPKEASAIHHIYDKDVENKPKFTQVAQKILDFIGNSDMAGYNSDKFDKIILCNEFNNVGFRFDADSRDWVDVCTIFHKMEPRNLTAAYRFFCDKDLEGTAHSAEGDTKATAEIFLAQIEKYAGKEVPQNDKKFPDSGILNDYAKFTAPTKFERFVLDDCGNVIFNFGKHLNRKLKDVLNSPDKSYIDWMLNKMDDLTKKEKQYLIDAKNELDGLLPF